jgi:hypothetical protein
MPQSNRSSGVFTLFAIVAFWLINAGAGLLFLTLAYGVVVIIFRYAFGVHLWNPFGAD